MNSIEQHYKSYFSDQQGYKGGKSGDPTQFDIIHKLSSNENPLGCSPQVMETLSSLTQNINTYPDPTDLNLRIALATLYEDRLTEPQFLCGNGGSEVIDWIIKGFVNPGDEVIVSSPYFVPYRSFSLWAGATVIDVPLHQEDYAIDVDGIIRAINKKSRIVFLTSPNNPTGTYINREQFEQLLDQIPSDVMIVYDEVYHHFIDAEDYPYAYEYIREYRNLVGINSFSKAYGLAGLRIGYGYFSPSVATYLRQIVRPFIVSKLSLYAAIAAINDQGWIDKCIAHNSIERDVLFKEMTALNIEVYQSHGNFLMFKPKSDHMELVNSLGDQGIFVRPLDNYMATGAIRVSVGTQENNQAFLTALKALV